ncbi:MAG TPA: hypothetical protein VFS17_08425 [Methylophilaceae bacterium]|nr:hypothetical protein [Methylophilaceae bacterium]
MEKQLELVDDLLWQKRAIHHALCGILPESDAMNALQVWASRFSASGSVFGGLNQFARVVCDTYGYPGRQHELVRAMNRALVGNPNELRPLPSLKPESAGDSEASEAVKTEPRMREIVMLDIGVGTIDPVGGQASETQNRTPEFDSFQALLPCLLSAIEQHKPELVPASRAFLREVVDNLPWSPAQQQQVLDLVEKGEAVQVRPYRAGQLKTLMSHLAVWLQEKLDKETALLIMRQGIKESGKTAAGMAYSPREFFSK